MKWQLTLENKIRLVQLYHENGRSYSAAQRKFSTENNIKRKSDCPSIPTIRKIITKFQKSGMVVKNFSRVKFSVNSIHKNAISTAFYNMKYQMINPSIRKLSIASGSSIGTVFNHLRNEMHLFPYKVSVGQPLSENHKVRRFVFAQRMLNKINKDATFLSHILWSDECSFSLGGWTNKQNMRIWASDKPTEVVEQSRLTEKVNVWIGMSSSMILGPFFFEHEGSTATINSQRYLNMLANDVLPILHASPSFNRIHFQQDGAPPHVSRIVKTFLLDNFGPHKVISRGFLNEWPAQSPDLSPLDFWLWTFLKEKVYPGGNPPQTKDELKLRIVNATQSVTQVHLHASVENVKVRLQKCIEKDGAHFE